MSDTTKYTKDELLMALRDLMYSGGKTLGCSVRI